jgi:hypothetical protein
LKRRMPHRCPTSTCRHRRVERGDAIISSLRRRQRPQREAPSTGPRRNTRARPCGGRPEEPSADVHPVEPPVVGVPERPRRPRNGSSRRLHRPTVMRARDREPGGTLRAPGRGRREARAHIRMSDRPDGANRHEACGKAPPGLATRASHVSSDETTRSCASTSRRRLGM